MTSPPNTPASSRPPNPPPPAPAAKAPPPPPPPPPERPPEEPEEPPTNFMPWIVIGGLLLAGAAAAFFLLYLDPLLDERDILHERVGELEERLGELEDKRAELEADNAKLTASVAELESSQEELSAAVAEREAQIEALQEAREELEDKLASDIESGHVTVRGEGNMLAVDLADEILFPSGKADLSDRGDGIIKRVCPSLLELEGRIVEVGGHTDARPIVGEKKERFPTNWELSTARATEVVRFLQEECDIPGKRLVAAGFSAYRPVASNRTARGRQRNRRIELVLRPPPPSHRRGSNR